ncbi:hypothetical protein AJ80_00580 [Polytolypa hystricis UAMH7299]|uniref:Protein kinase domain-containing protein n=1 Tax=Polytolypa hystricis (strain UAMH7299) TaxID=1447883 RepID=A0A2B7Z408_POLH7|nr:hypothetical protein AJ80_00580 [Polytolypa hystricis UAMH7299]
MGGEVEHELNIYHRLNQGPKYHPGRAAVQTLINLFKVSGPDSEHHCLVHPLLWDSMKVFLARNPIHRLPEVMLAVVLQRLFLALDFTHSECHIIHTDINAGNIMFGIEDDDVFKEFEKDEKMDLSPRKKTNRRVVYVSRQLQVPKRLGPPVLCDFGSTVLRETEHDDDVQPDIYRSPEVILQVPWSYPILLIFGMLVAWHLFYGTDPEHHKYRSRAHLAAVIAVLGLPPLDFINRGKLNRNSSQKTVSTFQAGIQLPASTALEALETNLDGKEKELFMQLMRKMLQWRPEDRKTAGELLDDPWLREQLG